MPLDLLPEVRRQPSGRPLTRQMLVRDRLIERLRLRWGQRVLVVSAAAGYGKTTLLSQAVAANVAAPVGFDCWVTGGVRSRVASSFGEALCRSVDVPPPSSCIDVDRVATAVADGVWGRSPQHVALIVDDVHEITPGSESAALLAAVVAVLPANGHLVLAGRSMPPVPLARLEVEGGVTQIDQSELAFTDDEIAGFAGLRQVDYERVADCGGWPALVELVAGSHRAIAGRYVEEEVIPDWPASRRGALALLAEFEQFDEPLARRVLGARVDVRDLLSGVPLIREVNGEGGQSWSIHSLWRAFLANDIDPSALVAGRRRAGRALLASGEVGPGLEMLIEAEAWPEVADGIVEALGAANPPVARDVLATWLERLPDDLRDSPHGQLLATMVTAFDADGAQTLLSLERCAAAFRAAGDVRGELASLVQLGLHAWWTEDPGRLTHLATRVFELEAEGCDDAVPLACIGRALIWDIAGDSNRVLTELDRIPPGSLGEVWEGVVAWLRSIGLLQMGHAREALEAADGAQARIGSIYPPVVGSRLQAVWYEGRMADVVEALPALYEAIERSGAHRHMALAAGQCSVVHALAGQRDEATKYLHATRRHAALATPGPLVDSSIAIAEAVSAVVAGEEDEAATILAAYVRRHPVDQGLCAGFHRRHLALLYVLVPDARAVWDASELGPTWVRARALARAVVAAREGRRLPNGTPLDDVALVQAHLPPPWVAELGVAAIAAGRDDGWQLLDGTWLTSRPTVAASAAKPAQEARIRIAAKAALRRLPVPPRRRLALELFGAIGLTVDDTPLQASDWRRERVRLLLAYLVLHPSASRSQTAEDLWPTLDERARDRNLRVTLTYLLRVLEPDRGSRDPSFFIRQDGTSLALHRSEWLDVDLWAFDTHATAVVEAERRGGAPQQVLDHALAAVDLWSEPHDLASEEWATRQVDQRRMQFAKLAVRAGELLLARGDVDQARALADQALETDPWREATHRLLVAAHRAAGDELAAKRAIESYREVLEELGVDPAEETLMVERLLSAPPA